MANKGGRPRKAGVERDAKGRIKAKLYRLTKSERQEAKESWQNDQRSMNVWRRVRDLVGAAAIDPRLGTRIGKMFLLGDPVTIDAAMFEAGMRLSQVLFIYDYRVLGRFTHAQAQDLSRTRGLSVAEDNVGLVKSAANAYAVCLTVLGSSEFETRDPDGTKIVVQKPGDSARAVMAVCRDEGGYYPPEMVKEALRTLAEYWGLYDNEDRRILRWRDKMVIAARKANVVTPEDAESFLASFESCEVSHQEENAA